MDLILFIDNTKVFEKWASKTYEYKINTIKENSKFVFADMDDLDKINPEQYNTVVFGWNATSISKFYTTKYSYYSRYVENLDHAEQIEKKLRKFFTIKNKYLVIQDLWDTDYEGGLPNLCKYLKKHKIKGVITPYNKTETMKYVLKQLPKLQVVHMAHHIDSNYFKDWEKTKKT